MGGGEAIDFADGPGLADVGAVGEEAHHADGAGGFVFKGVGDEKLRRAVVVGIHGPGVDHALEAGGEHVAIPVWGFEPEEFGHAGGEGDEVGLAVLVDVGGDDLIAALEVRGQDATFKVGEACLGEGGEGEQAFRSWQPSGRFSRHWGRERHMNVKRMYWGRHKYGMRAHPYRGHFRE